MQNPANAFVDAEGKFPLKTIISLVRNSEDAYIIRVGSHVAACLLVVDSSYESECHSLLNWIIESIKAYGKSPTFGPHREAEAAVSALTVCLLCVD